jgi:hypothetical protein
LARERPDLELVREPSLDALRHLELPDAIVIDGDHNHYTVSEELRIVIERSASAPLPLLLFHDVGWPHGRRDAYYSPALIPEDRRRPITEGGGLVPWDPGTTEEGLRYKYPASREGGPGNGVLTAVEDVVAGHPQLRLAVVQAFFGFGAVWDTRAPWADAVAALLDPWDRDPVFERLEADRVLHLATQVVHKVQTDRALARIARQDELLSRLLGSRTLALAERIGRLRRGGRAEVSREDVRRVLEP